MNDAIQTDENVQDLVWMLNHSKKEARAAGRVAAVSTSALVGVWVTIIPFLKSLPLHTYWDSIGKYLLPISSLPFLFSIYAVGQYFIRRQMVSEYRTELSQLLEDRYGVNNTKHLAELGVQI